MSAGLIAGINSLTKTVYVAPVVLSSGGLLVLSVDNPVETLREHLLWTVLTFRRKELLFLLIRHVVVNQMSQRTKDKLPLRLVAN